MASCSSAGRSLSGKGSSASSSASRAACGAPGRARVRGFSLALMLWGVLPGPLEACDKLVGRQGYCIAYVVPSQP